MKLSILSVISVLSLCTWNLRRYMHLLYSERLASETRGSKFLSSDHFPLLVNLLVGDLVSALGFAMNIVVR